MRSLLFGVALCLGIAVMPGFGAVVFQLDCELSNTTCTPLAQSLGAVTITDVSGLPGLVSIQVDTAFGGKYKNLFLNYQSLPSNVLDPAVFHSNGFRLNPYRGSFDIGRDLRPAKGFDGTSGVAFFLQDLSAGQFISLDSLGVTYLAIHLQEISCVAGACTPGQGSIKVGSLSYFTPPGNDPGGEIPEPATVWVAGAGLCAIAYLARRWRN